MGRASYYADGQWNFYCDLCGQKRKSGQGVKTWDGFYVCKEHKEQRNPQDFVRGVKDDQHVPWSRPQVPNTFVVPTNRLMLESGGALLQEVDAFGNAGFILI